MPEEPARVDRILLRDVFNTGLPSPVVRDAALFGTTPLAGSEVVPSDHYGVVIELDVHNL